MMQAIFKQVYQELLRGGIKIKDITERLTMYCNSTGFTLRKNFPNKEFLLPLFSRIWTKRGDLQINLRIQSKYGKIRTNKTPYLDTCSAIFIDNYKKQLMKTN